MRLKPRQTEPAPQIDAQKKLDQKSMTSNLFTNRKRKLQPPKICIAPPVDLDAPLGPLGSRLQMWADMQRPFPPGYTFSLSEIFPLINTGIPRKFEGKTTSPGNSISAILRIAPDFQTCQLDVMCSKPGHPNWKYWNWYWPVQQPNPFDTGHLFLDESWWNINMRITL